MGVRAVKDLKILKIFDLMMGGFEKTGDQKS